MAIDRWDPFRELEVVSNRLSRMFGGAPGAMRPTFGGGEWLPTTDVSETAEEYVIKTELPGVPKEAVKVTIDRGVLKIAGERKEEKEEKDKRYHYIERATGSFSRSFTLPETVDEAKLSAEFQQGLLTVRLPKMSPRKALPIDVKIS